ncbi:MAG: entericidin EcnAB [Candidatus Omnitrophica bacterium]|nr:entericidin EcnAB [Candidatus Omnitrophota bacterium]MBU1997457.1 entericidin EcnAB [Candidatus Omnitrophota bacterium]MBU4332993.1 entericidin EcnAB [Candidatus Omnitrophota bacterium]
MKRLLLLVILLSLATTLTGCETFKGIAQDIENTGRNIKDVLNKN